MARALGRVNSRKPPKRQAQTLGQRERTRILALFVPQTGTKLEFLDSDRPIIYQDC
jgi:hypothetical protein